MKKLISVILAVLTLTAMFALCGSAKKTELAFDKDGNFKIVHICDIQDVYPMNATTKQFIKEMLADVKPDLVILGGDNNVAQLEDNVTTTIKDGKTASLKYLIDGDDKRKLSDAEFKEETGRERSEVLEEYIEAVKVVKQNAIKEIAGLFAESETYFTLVFGNHDHQQFGPTSEERREEFKEYMLSLYREYGEGYCLAVDAEPELFGVGTHNLPIYSHNGEKVAFNLYMFDSNTYFSNENGSGYDAVHDDQIAWYEGVAAELKANNNGKAVPAMAFQHIIVQEVYDKLFIKSPVKLSKIGESFEGNEYEGIKNFSYLPKVANIKCGYLFEKPCPGYINYGQFSALKKTGDVIAIFSGHDHTNDYTTVIDGIDVTNTGGCTYHSYGSNLNRGVRVIELNERKPESYKTYTYTVAEACLKDGSKICDNGDISKFEARFALIGGKLLNALMYFVKAIFFFVK